MMTSYPLIMIVNGKHPATTLKDFIAWAKANADKTNYASTSAVFTLTSELFKLKTGTPGQVIPFKSSNDSVMSVVSNQVTYAIAEPPPIVPQITSGNALALGVASPVRLVELPDVPTMAEGGVDMNVVLWLGLFAPVARSRMSPHRAASRFQGEAALDVDGRARHHVGRIRQDDRRGDQAVDRRRSAVGRDVRAIAAIKSNVLLPRARDHSTRATTRAGLASPPLIFNGRATSTNLLLPICERLVTN